MKLSKLSLDSINIFRDEYLASYIGETNITASELRDKLKADFAKLADRLYESNLLNPAYIAASQYNNLLQDNKTGTLFIDYVVGLGFEDFDGEAIYKALMEKFEKERIALSKPSETVYDKGEDIKSVLDKKVIGYVSDIVPVRINCCIYPLVRIYIKEAYRKLFLNKKGKEKAHYWRVEAMVFNRNKFSEPNEDGVKLVGKVIDSIPGLMISIYEGKRKPDQTVPAYNEFRADLNKYGTGTITVKFHQPLLQRVSLGMRLCVEFDEGTQLVFGKVVEIKDNKVVFSVDTTEVFFPIVAMDGTVLARDYWIEEAKNTISLIPTFPPLKRIEND